MVGEEYLKSSNSGLKYIFFRGGIYCMEPRLNSYISVWARGQSRSVAMEHRNRKVSESFSITRRCVNVLCVEQGRNQICGECDYLGWSISMCFKTCKYCIILIKVGLHVITFNLCK